MNWTVPHSKIAGAGAAALRTGGLLVVAAAFFALAIHTLALFGIIGVYVYESSTLSRRSDFWPIAMYGWPVFVGLLQFGTSLAVYAIAEMGAQRIVDGERSLWPVLAALAIGTQPLFALVGSSISLQVFGIVAWAWIAPIAIYCGMIGVVCYMSVASAEVSRPDQVQEAAGVLQVVLTTWIIGWVALPLWSFQGAWSTMATDSFLNRGRTSHEALAGMLSGTVLTGLAVPTAAILLLLCILTLVALQDAGRKRPQSAPLLLIVLGGLIATSLFAAVATLQMVGTVTWAALMLMLLGAAVHVLTRPKPLCTTIGPWQMSDGSGSAWVATSRAMTPDTYRVPMVEENSSQTSCAAA